MNKIDILNQYRFVKCYPMIPGITDNPNITKIRLEARAYTILKVDPGQNRAGQPELIQYDTTIPATFLEFIAPAEIIDSLSHQYETPESIIQNTSGKITQTVEEVKNLFGKGNTFGHARVDVPIHYKDSEHRKYDFVFNLSSYDDPESNIVLPVYILKTLSCPTAAGENGALGKFNTNILPPCVFKIKIMPSVGKSIVYMKYAALESVQATYKGPYNKGKPTVCDLQLSFREHSPLFDNNFMEDDMNNVNITSTINGKTSPTTVQQNKGEQGPSYDEFWGTKSNNGTGYYGGRTKEQYQRYTSQSKWLNL